MNRNQAKEFFPIIQAFAEGKVIECRTRTWELNKGWQYSTNWKKTEELKFQDTYEYRIKPEPKYRSFKNAEECWNEMQKHQPFGWVKDKKDVHHRVLITAVDDDTCGMSLNGNAAWSLSGIMDLYTFADGTPFGVKVEE